MNDGHQLVMVPTGVGTSMTPVCHRCGQAWPCDAEKQWQRIRDSLLAAAELEEVAARSRVNRR